MLATEITRFRQVHIAFPLISQKKVQFLVLFYLFGAISLYILVEGVPPRQTLTVLLCTPPQSPCLAFYAFMRNATEMPQNKFCNTSASIPVYRSNCRLTLYDSTTASCFYTFLGKICPFRIKFLYLQRTHTMNFSPNSDDYICFYTPYLPSSP